jgi:hypothetical protein
MSTIDVPAVASATTTPAVPATESTTSGPGAGNHPANAKVAIKFLGSDSDDSLVIAIGRILAAMAGNAVYPAPQPTLAVVGAARDAYVSAVLVAKDRSRTAILRRNQLRAAVVAQMRTLALYVQNACGGDPVKLASSGFPAQKGRGLRIGILPPPQNLRLTRSLTAGELRARCNTVAGAMAYQWRWSTAQAPTAWTTSDPVSTASFTIEGQAEGTACNVQVRVFSRSGPSDWSDVAVMVVG